MLILAYNQIILTCFNMVKVLWFYLLKCLRNKCFAKKNWYDILSYWNYLQLIRFLMKKWHYTHDMTLMCCLLMRSRSYNVHCNPMWYTSWFIYTWWDLYPYLNGLLFLISYLFFTTDRVISMPNAIIMNCLEIMFFRRGHTDHILPACGFNLQSNSLWNEFRSCFLLSMLRLRVL